MSVTRNLIPNEDKKQDDTARDYENIVLELEDLQKPEFGPDKLQDEGSVTKREVQYENLIDKEE